MDVQLENDLVFWIHHVGKGDISLVGGKGANLGEMIRAGFPIPRAFSISALAYKRQIEQTIIASKLEELEREHSHDPEYQSHSSRKLFLETPMLPEIEERIREYYRQLGNEVRVAVRSSATAEDLPEASFAGQQETFLGVHGEEALLHSVRECWASLWGERAVHYRNQQGFTHSSVALSVVVQEMVDSDAAGVLFTVNPLNSCHDQMLITASLGLGEAVVSGIVTPDTYRIAKETLEIIDCEIGKKEEMVVQQEQGSVVVPVPPQLQTRPCLSDSMVIDLCRIAKKVEEHYGSPQDIEWAVKHDRIYLLQSRPITTLHSLQHATDGAIRLPDEDEQVYAGWIYLGRIPRFARKRFLPVLVDHFPEPLRPLDFDSSLTPALAGVRRAAKELGIEMPEDISYQHPTGLILFNPPVPANLRTIAALPVAWLKLKGWIKYDPLQEWLQVDQPYLRSLLPVESVHLDSSPQDLVREIKKLEGVISELMYRRFRKYMAAGVAAQSKLDKMLHRANVKQVYLMKQKLLQALDYKTAVANRDMKELARVAAASPVVLDILEKQPFGRMYETIMNSDGCRAFKEAIGRFLSKHGCRCASGMEPQPSYPSWRDEPDNVLSMVQALIQHPEGLIDDKKERTEEYHNARAEIVRRLKKPQWIETFEKALDMTRGFWVAREATLDMYEEIVAILRDRIKRVAAWLIAEEKIRDERDLYFVTFNELESMIADKHEAEMAELALQRREVWNRMNNYRSSDAINKSEIEEKVLTGAGASQGEAQGVVKVIRGPQEFHKLKRGDILVCANTNPAWTPLFSVAAAVVTDTGGVLSHSAIVAREYGIPAVMACENATKFLSDGDRVIVNGTTGMVQLLR
ncbi:PEP/pyruvate-binding domain-containing protein [Paenibacillaceae sp. P-4]|uniref:PEP/pyruvate-binding domain-containing protein n=1 Tax=Paenibacillaceae bacterium P-4 TaxID=3160969 RepID=UPI0032E8053B